MVLVIDNYDSFTFNLVHYLGELGAEIRVVRNDAMGVADVAALRPERILISPGPCTPDEAGISVEVVKRLGKTTPILGVCLGHQCIGRAYGGRIIRAARLMHGKTSLIYHDGRGVLKGMSNPFEATRYHSLIVERVSLPDRLVVTAETEEGEIMGLQHVEYPVFGVQFHPESILTRDGRRIVRNFLNL